MSVHDTFVILNYISVAVMFCCTVAVATHTPSRMQKLALLVCMALSGCCLGFLFRIEARTAEGLITGQKLVYAFVTHGMYLMLLFILEYCGFKIPRTPRYAFPALNFLITIVVLTLDHHTLFYKSYWAVDMGGYCVLEKVYGPFHTVAVVIFGIYMAAAVVASVEFAFKNKKRRAYVLRMELAVSLPCLSYIIPKLFDWETDLQPIAFAAFMVMVIVMIYRYNLYDVGNIALDYSLQSMQDALIVLDADGDFKGCNDRAKLLFPALTKATLDSNLNREFPELTGFLDGSVKEYRFGDSFYDVDVRLVSGAGEEGTVVWFRDVTLERKYTDLLKEQVDTLYIYSYRDELTGLSNRRHYEEALNELRSMSVLPPLMFVTLDLNGLKAVNDSIGHSAGDALLRGAAEAMKEVFSDEGQIFRIGGDEFFVIIKNPRYSAARYEDDLQKVCARWNEIPERELSLSAGFAEVGAYENLSVDELMNRSDRAMYESKRRFYEKSGADRRGKI